MSCCCSCAASTVKYLLFFFNLLFALGGLAIITLGTLIQINLNFFDDFFGNNAAIPSIFLIVVGSIVFLISFFGCCGAIRESRCMLITYASSLGVLLVLLITGAVLAFIFIDKADEEMYGKMKESMNKYVGDGPEAENAKEKWDFMQQDLSCCGTDSYMDWLVPPGEGGPGLRRPPASCNCINSEAECVTEMNAYAEGCYDKVTGIVSALQYYIGGLAIAVGALELVGIIFSSCLASSIKSKREAKWTA